MAGIRVFTGIAVLAAAVAIGIPGSASASSPPTGHYAGDDGVAFHVRLSEHGTPTVEDARYHAHSTFHRAHVHGDRSFKSCGTARINSHQFNEYCIHGEFGAHDHTWGMVDVFHGVRLNGQTHVAAKPYESHHWRAALTG
jgi:hypothetical protein